MELLESLKLKPLNYIGPSMNPLLKSGDRLEIVSCNREKIRVGDVVVFYSPEDETKVVHRVVCSDSDGIKTRGDNCSHTDERILKHEHILGRVISATRGNRRFRVFGGTLGHSLAMTIRAIKMTDSFLSPLLHPFYQRLARKVALRRWLPSRMRPRVISFKREAGTELQLVMGRRVIGRWSEGKRGWHIRRPFRLFVDEGALPENKAEVSGVGFQVSGVSKNI
jgi:mRNA-degrading endonuclease RelE of RelBE toxin-antitoxin system